MFLFDLYLWFGQSQYCFINLSFNFSFCKWPLFSFFLLLYVPNLSPSFWSPRSFVCNFISILMSKLTSFYLVTSYNNSFLDFSLFFYKCNSFFLYFCNSSTLTFTLFFFIRLCVSLSYYIKLWFFLGISIYFFIFLCLFPFLTLTTFDSF